MGVAIVFLAILALVVIAAIVMNKPESAEAAVAAAIAPAQPAVQERPAPGPGDIVHDMGKVRPPLKDFHVKGGEAIVTFGVPLPESGADDVLRDLLLREAVEVLADKRAGGLPIDDVTRVRVLAMQGDTPVEVASLDLEEPGVLPDVKAPDLIPHAHAAGFDPLDQLEDELPSTPPSFADVKKEGTLPPLHEELRMTSTLLAGLRTQGIDPERMTVTDLTLGLLRLAGYAVTPGRRPATYLASRSGKTTFVMTVDHKPGAYPELEEQKVNEFLIAFGESGADRGILVSDKFGPFMVYDKERREPRVKFITRERLQAFVDSFAIG